MSGNKDSYTDTVDGQARAARAMICIMLSPRLVDG